MPLPADLTTITVTGTYPDLLGEPLNGYVMFTLAQPETDAVGRVTIAAGTYPAPVVNGSFSITLPCTDNANLNPAGFAYLVTEQVPGIWRQNTYQLPHTLGASVDITALTPVNPPTPYSTVYGVLANSQTWTGANTFTGETIVPTPVNAADAATKAYVDGHGGGPPSGAAGGDLTGTYPNPTLAGTANVEAVIRANRLDQFAAPTAGIAMNGQKLTGLANGTAPGDSATVGQLPSGGTQITLRQQYLTGGPIIFNNDAGWTLYTAVSLSIPSAVGDWVKLHVGGMWQPGSDFIDWAVVVAGVAVRYSSTDTGTPGIEGDPAFYPGAGFVKASGLFNFQVTSGDLSGGNVVFAVAHKGSGGTLYDSSNYPLRLEAESLHSVL